MWLPSQMTLPQHAENFRQMGVAVSAASLADPLAAPLAAVVSLGGCTASFVSAQGLLVTNHHCVQGALQNNSDKDHNYVEQGFLAKSRAEELSIGANGRVFVAQAIRDVTRQVRDGLEDIEEDTKRKEESETRIKTLVRECEAGKPGIKCNVSTFFRGGLYQLITYAEIRDVRLAYAPKRSVGNYGGEVDNWAWPRHTGDFAFYRAYVGKDGKPADYSPDNVPYEPKHYLKVSSTGLRDADFVMVTGYPGRTERTSTASEVHHNVDWYYPHLIQYLRQRYDVTEQLIKTGGNTAIKATVAKQGIQNRLEKTEGIYAGLTKGDLLARKDAADAEVRSWAAKPGNEASARALVELDKQLSLARSKAAVDFERDAFLESSRLLTAAIGIVRMAEERAKPDAQRKSGYQERDMPARLGAQKVFSKGYDRALDRAWLKLALKRVLALPESERAWLRAVLGVSAKQPLSEASVDASLTAMYAGTKLEADETRLLLLRSANLRELRASSDPFVRAAVALLPVLQAKDKHDDALAGALMLSAPVYVEAMRNARGGFLAPDANSTLRITYGTVRGFKPGSIAVDDRPFTLAAQIPKKNTGVEPFNAPKAVLDAIAAKNYGPYVDEKLGRELPVDFLSDLDITGGNSGSPTLNSAGELVGLAFDGTIEGVSSDVIFDSNIVRTIHVDARYMLWMMDAIDGADHLLEEMGVKPSIR